jgi:hypothetical protein
VTPLFLGYDAVERPIRLNAEDRRIHTHIIGSSGTGKSKLLEWMMRGDLRNRQGFCLLDPEGTLYEEVLDYAAHWVLRREIIPLNLSQPDRIIPYNPFQRDPETEVSVQVDHCITATLHAWNQPDPEKTPTLIRTLRLIYTVIIERNLGVAQARHLIDFDAGEIREHLIRDLDTPLIEKEWRQLQALRRLKDWREEMLSAINRLFPLLSSKTLTRFMSVSNRSLNLREIMDQGKVLLVNLAESASLSQDTARLVGALLVHDFYHSALRRKPDGLGRDPEPYYLYVDEFQDFVSLDIAKALYRSRKRGLFMVLSHQTFGQLDQQKFDADLADAVLGNCGIKIVFGGLVTPSARRMAEEIFIGELDPLRIKVLIWQTKFWPQYQRDKVLTSSTTDAFSTGASESVGTGSFSGVGAGTFFQPVDWFGQELVGTSRVATTADSQFAGRTRSTTEMHADAEAVADIPILLPGAVSGNIEPANLAHR